MGRKREGESEGRTRNGGGRNREKGEEGYCLREILGYGTIYFQLFMVDWSREVMGQRYREAN